MRLPCENSQCTHLPSTFGARARPRGRGDRGRMNAASSHAQMYKLFLQKRPGDGTATSRGHMYKLSRPAQARHRRGTGLAQAGHRCAAAARTRPLLLCSTREVERGSIYTQYPRHTPRPATAPWRSLHFTSYTRQSPRKILLVSVLRSRFRVPSRNGNLGRLRAHEAAEFRPRAEVGRARVRDGISVIVDVRHRTAARFVAPQM